MYKGDALVSIRSNANQLWVLVSLCMWKRVGSIFPQLCFDALPQCVTVMCDWLYSEQAPHFFTLLSWYLLLGETFRNGDADLITDKNYKCVSSKKILSKFNPDLTHVGTCRTQAQGQTSDPGAVTYCKVFKSHFFITVLPFEVKISMKI